MSEMKWNPVFDGDGVMPEVDAEGVSEDVLVSFSNVPWLDIGQYRVDEEGGAWYHGDDVWPYTAIGAFVNAWMELPERYDEEEMK